MGIGTTEVEPIAATIEKVIRSSPAPTARESIKFVPTAIHSSTKQHPPQESWIFVPSSWNHICLHDVEPYSLDLKIIQRNSEIFFNFLKISDKSREFSENFLETSRRKGNNSHELLKYFRSNFMKFSRNFEWFIKIVEKLTKKFGIILEELWRLGK